ncbi:MAG TPA: hypothetical protein VH678_18550 [Xanthobacteraceae bacterium]|jgi:hypothetical protein
MRRLAVAIELGFAAAAGTFAAMALRPQPSVANADKILEREMSSLLHRHGMNSDRLTLLVLIGIAVVLWCGAWGLFGIGIALAINTINITSEAHVYIAGTISPFLGAVLLIGINQLEPREKEIRANQAV